MKRWLFALAAAMIVTLSAVSALADGRPVLMADRIVAAWDTPLAGYSMGSDIPRYKIGSIVFSDSLKHRPDDAWDVSDGGVGTVWAWVTPWKNNLYEMTIAGEGGVTLNRDCVNLFGGYSDLRQIDFGDHVDTSEVTDMTGMFWDCKKLTELDLSGFDTSKVMDMSQMFGSCSALKKLDLSGVDTSGVRNMTMMFYGCERLTKLDLSGFDTGSVKGMGNMFWGCARLKELDLSGFDTSKVTDMSGMFTFCTGIKKLDLSGFDTSEVGDMREMFFGCSQLKELDLSSFDTSMVKNMDSMFANCNKLKKIVISQAFLSGFREDTEKMFYGCGTKSIDGCTIR